MRRSSTPRARLRQCTRGETAQPACGDRTRPTRGRLRPATRLWNRWGLTGVVALVAACAAPPGPVGDAKPGGGPVPATGATTWDALAATRDAPPTIGHGTLRQDEFTISLRDGPLLIKVTPLVQSVIRLAAPDTYERLHALAESRGAELAAMVAEDSPTLFLVSFFSYQPDTPFQPDDLQLENQGRRLRARAVLPLTPGWGAQRLTQQEVQNAVYAFPADIDLDLPLTVRYGWAESDAWNQILSRLRIERAKVRAREGG